MSDNYELCSYRIYEMSSERNISGRRKVKLILHEIFPTHDVWQTNGISWDKEYTQQNMDSAVGMSICVEFIGEDRRLPYGHGLTEIKDNMPYMEDATMVGHCEKAYIDLIEIDGENKLALIAEGYIDEMRYPKFVTWLADRLANGSVKGSVEIVGRPENGNRIIYDGGWKEEGRIPQVYDYSGYAILGIRPADDTAIVVELNNKLHENKEDTFMDEKVLAQFVTDMKSSVTQVISELNNKSAEYEKQIEALNAQLTEKDTEISELNAKISAADATIAERDQAIEAQTAELNAIKDTNATLEKEKKIAELNAVLADYSAEEQALAQTEIDAFKADPATVEINSITSKICVEMVRLNKEARTNEQNASSTPDIFGSISDPKAEEVEIF